MLFIHWRGKNNMKNMQLSYRLTWNWYQSKQRSENFSAFQYLRRITLTNRNEVHDKIRSINSGRAVFTKWQFCQLLCMSVKQGLLLWGKYNIKEANEHGWRKDKEQFTSAKVKGYKSKNYNRSIFVTLQPIFHITCNLTKPSFQPQVRV
jgi:hypothetical protein